MWGKCLNVIENIGDWNRSESGRVDAVHTNKIESERMCVCAWLASVDEMTRHCKREYIASDVRMRFISLS